MLLTQTYISMLGNPLAILYSCRIFIEMEELRVYKRPLKLSGLYPGYKNFPYFVRQLYLFNCIHTYEQQPYSIINLTYRLSFIYWQGNNIYDFAIYYNRFCKEKFMSHLFVIKLFVILTMLFVYAGCDPSQGPLQARVM